MKKFCMLLLCGLFSFAEAQMTVVSTIPALGLLVKEIGGEHVEVKNLFEQPTDPHFFQLTPKQLIILRQADFVITAEEFSDKIPLPNSKIISINHKNEQSKRYIHALQHLQGHPHHEHAHEHHECSCHHATTIRHEWISFYGAIALNEVIAEKLSEKEPEYADFFHQNSAEASQRIKELKNRYRYKTLSNQSIAYHDNFKNLSHELHHDLGPALYRCEESNISANEMASLVANQKNYVSLLIDNTTNPQALDKITEKLKMPVVVVDTLGYGQPKSFVQFLDKILEKIYQQPENYPVTDEPEKF